MEGGTDPCFGSEEIGPPAEDLGGGAGGKRGCGSQGGGREGAGRGAAEHGGELQVGKAAQSLEVEEGTGEAFVFGFLAAELGGGNQAGPFAFPHGGDDVLVGGD